MRIGSDWYGSQVNSMNDGSASPFGFNFLKVTFSDEKLPTADCVSDFAATVIFSDAGNSFDNINLHAVIYVF